MNKLKLLSTLLKIIKLYDLSETNEVDTEQQEPYFLPPASKKSPVHSYKKYILGSVLATLGLTGIGGAGLYFAFEDHNNKNNTVPKTTPEESITPELIEMITKKVQEEAKKNNQIVPSPTPTIAVTKEPIVAVQDPITTPQPVVETDPLLGTFPEKMVNFHFGQALIPYETLKSTYTFNHIKKSSSDSVFLGIINTLQTSSNWKKRKWVLKKNFQNLDTRNHQNISLKVFYKNVFVEEDNISINKVQFNNKSYLIYVDKKTESFSLLKKEDSSNTLQSVNTYTFIGFLEGIHRDFVEKALTNIE